MGEEDVKQNRSNAVFLICFMLGLKHLSKHSSVICG